ncbi:MAG: UDP-N-acetylglucosamine--N-acetylmuramyl-(pentapeptide) pyrophosphoryl-undecaprenol N-acetylglucosamine transferase [Cycloclasticus sp. symbiont of Bathymodiolus heckerae]|nr:MAG: UDP-N-acetylglucosamine--N-acetylmuramyl-(pentapeptide) pyrophosphoryl-undecaprenol N-acetylglucosamine transferase [Cycloclasticus sp. symbiont of Bathymodiolus heckerae]
MAIRVMIMAGGTGGHVFPALAVAEYLRDAGHQVSWLGTKKGIEARIIPDVGFAMDWLSVSGLRGKGIMSLLLAPFMLLKACVQASKFIRQRQPDVVLGLGGFASGPGGLMSWLHGKPLVIHEQNRVPGTTNRLLKSIAKRVLEAFPDSFDKQSKAIFTGNPVRKELLEAVVKKEHRGINILIVGGSLGASILNEVVPKALKELQHKSDINVIHQAGKATIETAVSAYQSADVEADVRVFIDDMNTVYQWADIVICRAGAMTISELAVMGLPAILVPLPHAIDDHQTKNAEYLENGGAAILMRQPAFTANSLSTILNKLISSKGRLKEMGEKARLLSKPDATKLVADICLEVAL